MTDQDKKYKLPIHDLPRMDMETHYTDLLEFRDFLEERGIETRRTRIERYLQYLDKLIKGDSIEAESIFKNSVDVPMQHSGDWYQYVLREVHELMWILAGLKSHLPEGIDDKLKLLVSGADFAVLDSNTLGRNTQFELRIASYFCQGGYDVDISQKTDVIARKKKHKFYIECKRIASRSALDKRLMEARNQLIKVLPKGKSARRSFGIVALDVTKIAYAHNGLTWGLTNEHARDNIQEKLKEIGKIAPLKKLFIDQPYIINCWMQIHIPAYIQYPAGCSTRFSSFFSPNSSLGRRASQAFHIFYKCFSIVSVPDPRSCKPKRLSVRKEFKFPAGSMFDFDEGLLMEFIHTGSTSARPQFEVVGGIEIEGTDYHFTYFDFDSVVNSFSESDREEMKSDLVKARVDIIMRMYVHKFPYEEE